MKPKRAKHCKVCNKLLREQNKSGYWGYHLVRSKEYKDYHKEYYIKNEKRKP